MCPSPRTAIAISSLGAAIVALSLAVKAGCGDAAPPRLGEAIAALAPGHRPLEARPSFAVDWAPFRSGATPAADVATREAAYATLLRAKVDGVPGGDRALALFYVARDEEGDEARALALLGLDDSVTPIAEPIDPPTELDRGTALLALGRVDEAYERFAAVIEVDPASTAARFGAAVALEAMGLQGRAIEAFEAALALEAEGPWADEARARLARLREPREPVKPLDVRKREAFVALSSAGPGQLGSFRPIAAELAAMGDGLLFRALEYLERLDPEGWRRRAREVDVHTGGTDAIQAGQLPPPAFLRLLDGPDPHLAIKSAQWAAYAAIIRGDRAGARALLARIADRCGDLGCLEESAIARSDEGTLLHREGLLVEALRLFETAERDLPEGFLDRRTEILVKRATVARDVGRLEEARRAFDAAARLERSMDDVTGLATALGFLADVQEKSGLSRCTEASLEETIGLAPPLEREIWASLQLAESLGSRPGRESDALRLAERVRERLASTELDVHRASAQRVIAELLLRQGDAARALAEAEAAVALARVRRSTAEFAGTLGVLASAARAVGDHGLAVAALEEAVSLEEHRAGAAPTPLASLRIRTASAEHRHRLAVLRGEAGDVSGALEALLGAPPPPPRPGECRLIAAVVDELLLVGTTSAAGTRFEVRLVEGRRLGTDGSEDDPGALAASLGSPWAADRCPPSADRLVLLDLPGAASAHFAPIARRARPATTIGVARLADAEWPRARPAGRALVLFEPAARVDENVPTLPAAGREAAAVQAALPGAVLLTGRAATPEALRREAPAAEFLHLAVHGVAPGGVGAASYLLLAGDHGRFHVADVLRLELGARHPVVVLPACRSAGQPVDLENDGAGLPWAFLSAGAGAVVAHVGLLDDLAGATFSQAFWAELARGSAPAEAVTAGAAAVEREHGREAAARFVLFF